MPRRDPTLRTVADMLKTLRQRTRPGQVIWFRGHSDRRWTLVPSLARDPKHLKAETALIKRFTQNAMQHVDVPPRTEWEWMFLMQHHRALTRLLDWSESPLTALYFAVCDRKAHEREGALWCLDPLALNKAANLNFDFTGEMPAFGMDPILESYLPSRVKDNPSELNSIAIVGPRNTRRMAAQLGTFTINHRLHTPIEAIGDGKHVWRWVIPADKKQVLLEELAYLGYSDLTLFPDLDQVAELSKEILNEV